MCMYIHTCIRMLCTLTSISLHPFLPGGHGVAPMGVFRFSDLQQTGQKQPSQLKHNNVRNVASIVRLSLLFFVSLLFSGLSVAGCFHSSWRTMRRERS